MTPPLATTGAVDEDDPVLSLLEPGQAVAGRAPLNRRTLGPATVVLLVFLRLYVILAVALVIYAFWHAAHG